MRIAFVSTFFGKNYGGAEVSAQLMAKALMQRGHEVLIFSSRKEAIAKEPSATVLTFLRLVPKKLFILGSPLVDSIYAFFLKKAFQKSKPDVIHVQDLFGLPAAVAAGRDLGIPVVATVRDNLPRRHKVFGLNVFGLRNKAYRTNLQLCENVIAISGFIRQELIQFGLASERVKVVYNALPHAQDKSSFVEDIPKIRVLALGRLHAEKGFDLLIEVFHLLKTKHLAELEIIGDGPEENALKEKVKKLKLEQSIHFRPSLPNPEVAQAYQSSDIVVFPSLYDEPLGRIAIEAGFYGKPVVAMNVGGIPEIVIDGETGFLVTKGDIQAFSQRLSQLIQDKGLRDRLGSQAKRSVEKRFAVSEICSQTEAIYKKPSVGLTLPQIQQDLSKQQKTFFYCLLLVVVIVIAFSFKEWFSPFSIVSSGDWKFYAKATVDSLRFQYLSTWLPDQGFGRVVLDLGQAPSYSIYGLLSRYFSLAYTFEEKIIHFLPAIFLSFGGMYLLGKKIFKDRLIALLSAIVYLFNTTFLTMLALVPTSAAAFSFFPLLFYLLMICIEATSLFFQVLFGLLAFVACAYEPRAFYVMSLGFVIYTVTYCVHKGVTFFFGCVKSLSIPAIVFVLLNVYWVLALAHAGSLQDNSLFSRELFGNNYWNVFSSFTLHFPWWTSQGITVFQNQSIPFFFWFVPAFAILGLILNRKNITVLSFAVIALIGVLLSKQVDVPFTNLYPWLFAHFPGFKAFRLATQFYSLVAIGYSILIGFFIEWIWTHWNKGSLQTVGRFVCTVLIAGLFLWNARPLITQEIGGLFVTRSIPNDYLVFNKFLLDQDGYFRTVWTPSVSRWSAFTEEKPQLLNVHLIQNAWSELFNQDTKITSYPDQLTSAFKANFSKAILDVSSIKYVLVPLRDPENDTDFFMDYGGKMDADIRQKYIDQLNQVSFLQKMNIGTEDLVVYENKDPRQPIFTFNRLVNLSSTQNLSEKYEFIQDRLQTDFLFAVAASNTLPLVSVFNPFEKISIPESSSQKIVGLEVVPSPSSTTTLYENRNRQVLIAESKKSKITFTQIEAGSLSLNGVSVTSSVSERLLKTYYGRSSVNYFVRQEERFSPLLDNQAIRIPITDRASTTTLYNTGINILTNGSFEFGLWQKKVGDCNNFDANPVIAMRLDRSSASQGRQSLELEATRHNACTQTQFFIPKADQYLLSFDYQSSSAKTAKYYLQFNDANKTTVAGTVAITDDQWHAFSRSITIPEGATVGHLFFYAIATDGQTVIQNHYDHVQLNRFIKIDSIPLVPQVGFEISSLEAAHETISTSYTDPALTFTNVISNPSFEMGAWQPSVTDCNAYDKNPQISMSVSSTTSSHGAQSLELTATRHSACTVLKVPVHAGSTYTMSFDYQSPNAKTARYYVSFDDASSTPITEILPVTDQEWHSFSKVFNTPLQATALSIYIYSQESDRATTIVNRYDNFKLIEIPDLRDNFYLVSQPEQKLIQPSTTTFELINPTKKLVHIKGATTPFFLGMSESYHDQWQLQSTNSKIQGWLNSWWPFAKPDRIEDQYHYQLDGFLNAWYVDIQDVCVVKKLCLQNPDGSYDLEMTIEFWPQRWFYLGLLISSFTLVSCLGYLGFVGGRGIYRRIQARK